MSGMYSLVVSGTLEASIKRDAQNVCAGRNEFGYCAVEPKTDLKVKVIVSVDSLDSRGFVADHDDVKRLVSNENIGVVDYSCEMIARKMIDNVRELFTDGRLRMIRIELTQWNDDGVILEESFKKPPVSRKK